jgi:protein TonB
MAALVIWAFRPGPPVVLPPIYKVNIVAAPPGPRAIGEVRPPESNPKEAPAPTPPPKAREVATPEPTIATKKAANTPAPRMTPGTVKAATKVQSKLPRAGGGPKGGRGTDVLTLQTEGLDFPYPGYLNNIVRQIRLNFKINNPNSPLRAEVAFIIHRDGTVTNFRFLTRSGVYAFDLAAQGAVEKAASQFGSLPDGFRDDALPVVFSFDPKFLQ